MTVSEFLQKYNISETEMKKHTCKSKTYSGTDDKIIFFFLPEERDFEGHKQRIFVLSHTAAQAYLDKTKKPGQLEIQFQADYGYGITMPLEGEAIEW